MKTLSQKIRTSIWQETPNPDNSFYPEYSFCHGFDFYNELLESKNFIELLFLTFTGDLPTKSQELHLSLLLSSVMNSGPRDLANRAAMSAAAGGAPAGSALIAGLCASTGKKEGGGAVQTVMEMITELRKKHRDKGIKQIPYSRIEKEYSRHGSIFGYGTLYGKKDSHAEKLTSLLYKNNFDGPGLRLFLKLGKSVEKRAGEWPRLYGVFASSLLDLGFSPLQGHGVYMLANGIGMLGFVCERYEQHWTDFPTWFTHGTYEYHPDILALKKERV
ncbi:MAG: hypothetical protein JW904_14890 [Spirochaetales bacterium]|nr:hypothetical protein [Spirochaetales bacterium]